MNFVATWFRGVFTQSVKKKILTFASTFIIFIGIMPRDFFEVLSLFICFWTSSGKTCIKLKDLFVMFSLIFKILGWKLCFMTAAATVELPPSSDGLLCACMDLVILVKYSLKICAMLSSSETILSSSVSTTYCG